MNGNYSIFQFPFLENLLILYVTKHFLADLNDSYNFQCSNFAFSGGILQVHLMNVAIIGKV